MVTTKKTCLVFSGDKVPQNLDDYSMVIYLMEQGYNNKPAEELANLYFESIEKNNSDEFFSFLSKYGMDDKDLLEEMICQSSLSFTLFVDYLKSYTPIVLDNFRNGLVSQELKKVVALLHSRTGTSVIVGEINLIPHLNLKSYVNRLPRHNILVVERVSVLYLNAKSKKPSVIAINGDWLLKGIDKKRIVPGVPIVVSNNKNGCFLPSFLDPKVNPIFMTQDIAEGVVCVRNNPCEIDI